MLYCSVSYETGILPIMRKVEEEKVEKQFVNRWSSRTFDGSPLTQEQIDILLEAVRWTPSSYNEQPWKFYYPQSENRKKEFLSLLVEGNREWAKDAGVLFFLAAKRLLDKTGEQNRHFAFDTGAAWMSLALQAHLIGLSAHAMGGFDENLAYEVLSVPKQEYEIFAAIAVGKPTQEAVTSEERTPRKFLSDISEAQP